MEQKEIKVNKTVIMMIKTRTFLLKLADAYGTNVSKKLQDLVTELGLKDTEEEITYVFEFMERQRWVAYTGLSKNHYNQFYFAITDHGVEIVEKLRDEKRWNKTLDVCLSINDFSIGTMLNVISRFEEKGIISAMEVAEVTQQ